MIKVGTQTLDIFLKKVNNKIEDASKYRFSITINTIQEILFIYNFRIKHFY